MVLIRFFSIMGVVLVGITMVVDASFAQTSTDALFQQLNEYKSKFPQEKIFVHFNRTHYQSGEEAWFKVYQVEAGRNRPSSISSVVYINLYSSSDSLIAQRLVKTKDGFGHGTFLIPSGLSHGIYTVKAYTNWMLNFNHNLAFSDQLVIYGRDIKTETSGNEGQLKIKFFPEGGYCSVGLPCRMGIKATTSGIPQSIRGNIITKSGEVAAPFQTNERGLGSAYFSPIRGMDYYAILTDNQQSFPVPKPREEGFSMQVKNTSSNGIQVAIHATRPHQTDEIMLILMMQGEIRLAASARIKDGGTLINLPKDSLPTGVAQITLFNRNVIPELERLIFVDNQSSVTPLKIGLEKDSYEKREKVNVKLTTLKALAESEAFNLSVTVREVDPEIDFWHKNIIDYLLIGSELSENSTVNYYGPDPSTLSSQDLDEVLMVEGWRRYKWADIMADNHPDAKYILERGGFHISGHIADSVSGNPVIASHVFASSSGMPAFFEYTKTDNHGRFNFFQLDFYGTHPVILSIDDTLATHERAKIFVSNKKESLRVKSLPRGTLEKIALNSDLAVGNQIKDFYSTFRSEPLVTPTNPDTMFLDPDKLLRMEDYVELPNMREVIRELLHGVRLRDRDGQNELRVMIYVHDDFDDSDVLRYYDEGPLILIDGHPSFNLDSLVAMDPNQLDSIGITYGRQRRIIDKVLDKTEFDGVLQIFINEDGEDYRSTKSLKQIVDGFQQYREFYFPDYAGQSNPRIPDFRTNLYWNPELKSDNGTANFEFYTADLKTKYEMIVQGISSDGDTIYERIIFSVD